MNRLERLSAVLDLLADTGQLEVDEIVSKLDVSPATARRDLDTLAEQQLLTRTRGGASALSVAYDLPSRYRRDAFGSQKDAIAAAASALVSRGDVVGLSGGTTSTALAAALAARPDILEPSSEPSLTVVTNAINIAAQLAMRTQIKTVVTGGVIHARSYELIGTFADAVLNGIALDIAFIGVNALDPVVGPTTHDEREASVNRLMAQRAARAVLIADSSKIGLKAFATMGSSRLFGTVITDDGIAAKDHRALTEHGYEVIVATAI